MSVAAIAAADRIAAVKAAAHDGEECGYDCGDGWVYLFTCGSGGKCCGWRNCSLGYTFAGCCYGGNVCDRNVGYPNWGCKPPTPESTSEDPCTNSA